MSVLLYSKEYGFWRTAGAGYTSCVARAGHFDEHTAEKILVAVGPEKALEVRTLDNEGKPCPRCGTCNQVLWQDRERQRSSRLRAQRVEAAALEEASAALLENVTLAERLEIAERLIEDLVEGGSLPESVRLPWMREEG